MSYIITFIVRFRFLMKKFFMCKLITNDTSTIENPLEYLYLKINDIFKNSLNININKDDINIGILYEYTNKIFTSDDINNEHLAFDIYIDDSFDHEFYINDELINLISELLKID